MALWRWVGGNQIICSWTTRGQPGWQLTWEGRGPHQGPLTSWEMDIVDIQWLTCCRHLGVHLNDRSDRCGVYERDEQTIFGGSSDPSVCYSTGRDWHLFFVVVCRVCPPQTETVIGHSLETSESILRRTIQQLTTVWEKRQLYAFVIYPLFSLHIFNSHSFFSYLFFIHTELMSLLYNTLCAVHETPSIPSVIAFQHFSLYLGTFYLYFHILQLSFELFWYAIFWILYYYLADGFYLWGLFKQMYLWYLLNVHRSEVVECVWNMHVSLVDEWYRSVEGPL